MYIDTSRLQSKSGKSYVRHLLRRCYREQGKIKHETIANLSHCSAEEIQAMKLAFKHKGNLEQLAERKEPVLTKGKAIGAVWVLLAIAKRLGMQKALGNSRHGRLALWQIFSRIIEQGSRLSSARLAARHAHEILELPAFTENDLYENLDWLAENQTKIEDSLFKTLGKKAQLFLYDVTSSYFEGHCNELAEFGYNRDGKKGKLQIVIGLLCNEDGTPISVEVFEGNTKDNKTLAEQIKKAALRFNAENVTFVGDRGMIKSMQIEELLEHGFHYITAITKPQVQSLLNNGVIQLSMLDDELAEVTDGKARYVLRRNPVRAEEIEKSREDKLASLRCLISAKNEYLAAHPRAKIQTAISAASHYAAKLKINKWIKIINADRALDISIDKEALARKSLFDGCYVLKTDLPQECANKETVHSAYKDLALVEQAFRSSKTIHLEMRPIYVRLASRTRGHVFVVMLAYRIIKELSQYWRQLDITVEEGISLLAGLCQIKVEANGACYYQIPNPDSLTEDLLSLADISLPKILPKENNNVTTIKKLPTRRKNL